MSRAWSCDATSSTLRPTIPSPGRLTCIPMASVETSGPTVKRMCWVEGIFLAIDVERRAPQLDPYVETRSPAGSFLPARMKNGTPAQRQLSIRSSAAAKVSTVEPGETPGSSR